MRPIPITAPVRLRLAGELIQPETGQWEPRQHGWNTYNANTLAAGFGKLVEARDALEQRAGRNWVIEAQYQTQFIPVDDVGDVQQVLDLGQIVTRHDDDEGQAPVVMNPWIVQRFGGELTMSRCPSRVLAIVVAPADAPHAEVIALLDEQLS